MVLRKELKDFAENLKRLRKEKNLTLRELAEELKIGKSTLSEYENAQKDPSLTNVKKIAGYFNESIDWLSGWTTVRRVKKIAK